MWAAPHNLKFELPGEAGQRVFGTPLPRLNRTRNESPRTRDSDLSAPGAGLAQTAIDTAPWGRRVSQRRDRQPLPLRQIFAGVVFPGFRLSAVLKTFEFPETQVEQEKESLKERNLSLAAEVHDLKQGYDAIEERARSEMGMIKEGETFYRIVDYSAFQINTN